MKVGCAVLLLLVSFTLSLAEGSNQQPDDHEAQDWLLALRRYQSESRLGKNQIDSNRRNLAETFHDEYLPTSRRDQLTMKRNKDSVIFLRNNATMAVRLIVFYIRLSGKPYLEDTKTISLNKTGSLKVPSDVNYVLVVVEKYSVDDFWHIAYTSTIAPATSVCLVVTGNAIESIVSECNPQ